MTKQNDVVERVLELIDGLPVGDAIPSERQLSSDLGVSRPTLRAALEGLVRGGYLVRRQGSGTFVGRPKIAQELTITSFSEDMRRRGMAPSSRTIELRVTTAGARLGQVLHVSPGEPIVVATRLRLADGDTMAIETLHIPSALVPGLRAKDLESGSFYDLLEQRYGIVIVSGIQTIEPTVTNEEESAALGVPLHSPAFLFERTSRARSGQIVESVRSIYRGDRYKLVTELSPNAGRELAGRSGSGHGVDNDQRRLQAAAEGGGT
jgi:GntR family transcriptional regulator